MGGTGLIAMRKIGETNDTVSYEYWYTDENDKGAMEFMKNDYGCKILREPKNDKLLMFSKVVSKLCGFKRKGTPYPDITSWAG